MGMIGFDVEERDSLRVGGARPASINRAHASCQRQQHPASRQHRCVRPFAWVGAQVSQGALSERERTVGKTAGSQERLSGGGACYPMASVAVGEPRFGESPDHAREENWIGTLRTRVRFPASPRMTRLETCTWFILHCHTLWQTNVWSEVNV